MTDVSDMARSLERRLRQNGHPQLRVTLAVDR